MKTHLLFGLALSTAPLVLAEETAVRIDRNVAFLAPGRTEELDVYLPTPPAAGKLSPAVVWIHGGGWTGGTKNEARAQEICTTLAAAGYVALSIDYKLGDGAWPANLLDCKNAIRFLRTHAADYRVDPARIAVAGGSAGGHLALMIGFTAGKKEWEPEELYPGVSSAVRCVIDMYGLADFSLLFGKPVTPVNRPLREGTLKAFGADSIDAAVFRAAEPITHAAKGAPPVLIMHGTADTTLEYVQSETLVRMLKERGVVYELVTLDGIGHTFDWETWNKKPLPRDLRPVALAFLEKYLAPAR